MIIKEQVTETAAEYWKDMDQWSITQLAKRLYASQVESLAASVGSDHLIAVAGEEAVKRLKGTQGRLVYCGAGSSGAQACLDGLELPGTYGWPKDRLVLLLAGGWDSFLTPDASEDDIDTAKSDILNLTLTSDDVFIAVSASGNTPYTLAAMTEAKKMGVFCIGMCNNPSASMEQADICIILNTGRETVAGSTRMAAGTAQKVALNSLSTLVMAKLGYLYDNLMIRMEVSNKKLVQRASKMVAKICNCKEEDALEKLIKAQYLVPIAVLMDCDLTFTEAHQLYNDHQQNLRAALEACK